MLAATLRVFNTEQILGVGKTTGRITFNHVESHARGQFKLFCLPEDVVSEAGLETIFELQVGEADVPVHERLTQLQLITGSTDTMTALYTSDQCSYRAQATLYRSLYHRISFVFLFSTHIEYNIKSHTISAMLRPSEIYLKYYQ